MWGGKCLHFYTTNLLKTICTKFYHNRLGLVDCISKTFWCVFFGPQCTFIESLSSFSILHLFPYRSSAFYVTQKFHWRAGPYNYVTPLPQNSDYTQHKENWCNVAHYKNDCNSVEQNQINIIKICGRTILHIILSVHCSPDRNNLETNALKLQSIHFCLIYQMTLALAMAQKDSRRRTATPSIWYIL